MTNYTIINASGATAAACAAQPNAARGITDAVAITALGDFLGLTNPAGVFYGKTGSNTVAIMNELARIMHAASAAADVKSQVAYALNALGTVDLSSLAKIEQFRLRRSQEDLKNIANAVGAAAVLS